MAGPSTRSGGWRNLVLGLVFAALGVWAFLAGPEDLRWQLAGAGVFLGSFLAITLGPWGKPTTAAPGLAESRATLRGLVADLDLEGPLYVVGKDAQPHLAEDRLFLADREVQPDQLPDLDTETTLYSGQAAGGLALVPPGGSLLARHRQSKSIDLDRLSLGELDTVLGSLVPGDRALENLVIRRVGQADRIRVRYRPIGDESLHPRPPEQGTRQATDAPRAASTSEEAADVRADVAASPVATALLVAVSNALDAPLRLETLRFRDRGQVEIEVTTGR